MSKRLEVFKFAPQAYKGFGMVKDYAASALPAELLELVYLRVSQINGCAYCIDMHTRDLLKQGVKIDKVALVPVWDEAAALFSEQERAALAWAEVVTRVEQSKVPDADYQQALSVLGEQTLADLTVAIALMNAFNRFGVSMRMQPAALTL
ncbi:carboxymuconolactone decarboxylase family protein [Duganella sp. FT80W]|jgi:AhpD family alkylhydroperoxidase|uniref:Carboxymuconolactone decarboxylase family protein n=1 Tax=Duganella guangzhouensis TaxID=2666084 RepID=A0A6I2KZ73_9BURK|nr:carboxymuconolactone decarboxylase family protein [Duganella guangzhouensis]MRW91141.1 carboxymuconolactone decarboxylase family protein [Duganella guangzhouensis]